MIKSSNELSRFIFILIFTITISYSNYFHVGLISYLLLFTGITLFVINYDWAVRFFLLSIIASSDISFDTGREDSVGLTSIFTVGIGPINISVLWTLIIIVILLFKQVKNNYLYKEIYFLICCVVLYSVLGVMYIGLPGSRWISDFAFLINIICGISIARYMVSNYQNYNLDKNISSDIVNFTYAFSAKMLVQILHAIYILKSYSFTNYLSESGIYISAIVIPLMIVFKDKFKNKIIYYVCFMLPILANMISASRGRIIIIMFCLIITLFLLKRLKLLLYLIPLTYISILAVRFYAPEYFEFFLWKLTSFEVGGDSSQSSTVRFVEIVNIINLHMENVYSMFIGLGFGSYFTSEYYQFPFGLYGTGSYPDIWVANDTFFKPHGSWQFIFMKFGLMGTILTFIYLPISSYMNLKRFNENDIQRMLLVVICSSIVPMFLVNFTSKLQLVSGLLIGLLFSIKKVNNE